jgi:hypothetical protein
MNLVGEAYGVYRRAMHSSTTRSNHVFKPREDAVRPLAIIITPAHFHIWLTLGSHAEMPARRAKSILSPRFGPLLAGLARGFSFRLIS